MYMMGMPIGGVQAVKQGKGRAFEVVQRSVARQRKGRQ